MKCMVMQALFNRGKKCGLHKKRYEKRREEKRSGVVGVVGVHKYPLKLLHVACLRYRILQNLLWVPKGRKLKANV